MHRARETSSLLQEEKQRLLANGKSVRPGAVSAKGFIDVIALHASCLCRSELVSRALCVLKSSRDKLAPTVEVAVV